MNFINIRNYKTFEESPRTFSNGPHNYIKPVEFEIENPVVRPKTIKTREKSGLTSDTCSVSACAGSEREKSPAVGLEPHGITSTAVASTTTAGMPLQAAFHRRWTTLSKASYSTEIDESIMNFTSRYRRKVDHEACVKFEEGDPYKQEFFSPGYPDRYPKDIDCYKVLEADPGMVLRVEFRDSFELEEHEKCENDYLDVHDGKYGYSRRLGKFCRAFPFPEITSSTRYLWLHFRSDGSIQGTGFRAVWKMIPRPTVKTPEPEECILNVTNHLEYIIRTSEIADRKKLAAEQGTEIDCVWNITVPEGYKIQITFPIFTLDKPNECDINYVQVFDKQPTMLNNPKIIQTFCGSIADLVTSADREAYLRFYVTKSAINSTFEAIMTAIREKGSGKDKDKGCTDDEFDCQDACISGNLRCNGRANCRFRFDEDPDICNKVNTGLDLHAPHVIIIIVVFTSILSGLVMVGLYNFIKVVIRDGRIIKGNYRESREKSLDELGRKSNPMIEPCTEIGGSDHHQHHHRHRHSSESPSLEVLANPKEQVSSVTVIDRDYARKRRSVSRVSLEVCDIHQSNNDSNATTERLQKETRDMEVQTRESIFDTGFILKPTAHPAFTTFGFQTPVSSRKQSLEYHPDHHYHHHAHPHHHAQPFTYHHHHHHLHRQEPGPCLQHSSTPPIVPAPHGFSGHGSVLYQPQDLAFLQRLGEATSPKRMATGVAGETELLNLSPSKYMVRQKTVGSGENYGFIFGADDNNSSEHTGSSATSSIRFGTAKPVKCPQVADSRFKTEAVIEVDQKRPDDHPREHESTQAQDSSVLTPSEKPEKPPGGGSLEASKASLVDDSAVVAS
ncbi:hypothetical protein TSAR_009458 [Trichomalopsis sarcophagae]|uniref:CUB domain-containing protein n=1 Tax=Trichomalopsis sarcophagae TaxID=543379 RepID=A0A232FMP5_9HYME|nr:hypothetical protein TSAR_009458 [Trichomalopsis sarcophagae]